MSKDNGGFNPKGLRFSRPEIPLAGIPIINPDLVGLKCKKCKNETFFIFPIYAIKIDRRKQPRKIGLFSNAYICVSCNNQWDPPTPTSEDFKRKTEEEGKSQKKNMK